MKDSNDSSHGSDDVFYIACPQCKAKKLLCRVHTHKVPYFEDVVETVMICKSCGFKHVDVFVASINEPKRHALRIDCKEDMSIRIARSDSATIRIDELGIVVEPGPASEAFISNVEGVLERVREALNRTLVLFKDDEAAEKKAFELMAQITRIENGAEKATLIIDDPFGNSAIISEKVMTRTLSEDEVKQLKKGMIVFDSTDFVKNFQNGKNLFSNE